jgi:molecular chaperone HscA
MLKDGFASAVADMAARKLREARVEAQRMDLATGSALAADGDLLEPGERSAIDALLVDLRRTAQAEDADAIEAATEALAKGTEAFAAARMNRGIQRALAGRSLDEV